MTTIELLDIANRDNLIDMFGQLPELTTTETLDKIGFIVEIVKKRALSTIMPETWNCVHPLKKYDLSDLCEGQPKSVYY